MTDHLHGYTGAVSPRVMFRFRGDRAASAGPYALPGYLYQYACEAMYRAEITLLFGGRSLTLRRNATASSPMYDAHENLYTLDPVSADDLNALGDAFASGPVTARVTLRVWFYKFFEQVVAYATRTSADTYNLARPESTAAVEATFQYTPPRRGSGSGRITQIRDQRELTNLPARLVRFDVTRAHHHGASPVVALIVYLETYEALSATQCFEAVRLLLTAEYSRLYQMCSTGTQLPFDTHATPRQRRAGEHRKNVLRFFGNYVSLDRGRRIRDEIYDAGFASASSGQGPAVRTVRDAIDARLVTSNHWGEDREQWTTEPYQKKLMDFFGGVHQRCFDVSPVSFIREYTPSLRRHGALDLDACTALILQFGTGHCGEHAWVSYQVIRDLIDSGAQGQNTFINVILSGNANVDHAFCIGGLLTEDVVATRHNNRASRTQPPDPPPPRGQSPRMTLQVVNMRELLAAGPNVGNDGYVLDPYLAPTAQAATVRGLLARLNAPSRGAIRTEYVAYVLEYPENPVLNVTTRNPLEHV